jgi:hypothetical protein
VNGESLFLDTNLLVYLFDTDVPSKKAIAEDLLRRHADVTVKIAAGAPCPPQPLWGRAGVGEPLHDTCSEGATSRCPRTFRMAG